MSERNDDDAETVPEAKSGADADTVVEDAAEKGGAETASDGEPLLQESPERAGRRLSRAGMRLGTRAALTLVIASLVPTGLAASAVLVLTSVKPVRPPPSPGVALEDLRAARAELDAVEATLARTSDEELAREQQRIERSLTGAAVALSRHGEEVKTARDDGDDAPLSADEVQAALASLGVTAEGSRRLTSLDGTRVVAPAGATLSMPAAELPPASPTVMWSSGSRAQRLARVCVDAAGLCLVDELTLPEAKTSLGSARLVVTRASALLSAREQGPVLAVPDLEALRRRVALAALAFALLSSLLLAWRLRRDLVVGLQTAEGRLRLLAAGQSSERSEGSRPRELADLEDAVDAVATALASSRERDDADRRRAERLFSLSEQVDVVSRGQLAKRLSSSDDVAEATLSAAVNRMIDAFEQKVVRLKSHTSALLATERPASFDDDDESDPAALIAKRVAGLKPIPPLLTEIGARLTTLAKVPPGEARVPLDLTRLSEAIAQRARAAQALFDSLEGLVARLPRGAGAAPASLTADERQALALLVRDLDALSVDASLPRLVESLPELSAGEVASRLARAKASA